MYTPYYPNPLQEECYRHIAPTVERVMKCSAEVLKSRLRREEEVVPTRGGKRALADALMEYIIDNMPLEKVLPDTTTIPTTAITTTPTVTPTATSTTATTTTPAVTPTTTIPTTATTTTPAVTPTATTPKVGDTLEVLWEDMGKWYPCVVKAQRGDVDNTTASLCHYDNEAQARWHNLDEEQHRTIPPTTKRLARLTCRAIRGRLAADGIAAPMGLRKPQLVNVLLDATSNTDTADTTHTAASGTADGIAAPMGLPQPQLVTAASNTDTPDTAAPEPERAKHGESHVSRRLRIKRRQTDRVEAADQAPSKRVRLDVSAMRKRQRELSCTPEAQHKKTATQATMGIGDHAQALYTLATRGSRRDDRQSEREGYNLITFSQAQMSGWDPNAHVWKADDNDMSLLHPNIASCYDTTGWCCINTFLDGDGVVFLRPTPPMLLRGCGAQRRRKNFKWTPEMGEWLQMRTHNLNFKSTPFVALALEAEQRWGYTAPKQEHIENRIKGREKAKKEGRPQPNWITQLAAS